MILFPPIHQTEAEHDGGRGKGQYPPLKTPRERADAAGPLTPHPPAGTARAGAGSRGHEADSRRDGSD